MDRQGGTMTNLKTTHAEVKAEIHMGGVEACLREISRILGVIATTERPIEVSQVKAPNVEVSAPQVNVEAPKVEAPPVYVNVPETKFTVPTPKVEVQNPPATKYYAVFIFLIILDILLRLWQEFGAQIVGRL